MSTGDIEAKPNDLHKGLYQRLDFKNIEPYYELPVDLKNWLVFMELHL